MLIVSQDGKTIVNFNNINMITVRENKIVSYDNTYTDSQNGDCLGTYTTEERAKEVLEEIIRTYEDTNYEYENCWCLRNLTYRMPKEEEKCLK